MKKLPVFSIDHGSLYEIIEAPVKSKLLQTAMEFRVFNHLTRSRTAGE